MYKKKFRVLIQLEANTQQCKFLLVENSVEKDVGISVDGKECHLLFIDHSHGQIRLENLIQTYDPQALLLVMAVDDIESFQLAEHVLVYLTHNGFIQEKVDTV